MPTKLLTHQQKDALQQLQRLRCILPPVQKARTSETNFARKLAGLSRVAESEKQLQLANQKLKLATEALKSAISASPKNPLVGRSAAAAPETAPSPTLIDGLDIDHYSTIWDSAKEGNLVQLREYRKNGHNLEVMNEEGWSLLHLTAKFNRLHALQLLIEFGCNIDGKNEKRSDETPLIVASTNGHHVAVKILLFHGCDPNAMDSFGMTSLMHAANEGHFEVVKVLLENGGTLLSPVAKSGKMERRNAEEIALYKARISRGCEEFSKFNDIRLYIMKMKDDAMKKACDKTEEGRLRRRLSMAGFRIDSEKVAGLCVGPNKSVPLKNILQSHEDPYLPNIRATDLQSLGVSRGKATRAVELWTLQQRREFEKMQERSERQH